MPNLPSAGCSSVASSPWRFLPAGLSFKASNLCFSAEMASPIDDAQRKIKEAEDYVHKLDFQNAAQTYHDAAAFFANGGNSRQSSLCEAKEDYYQSVAHIQSGDYDAAKNRAESAYKKFQQVHDELWTAKSRALSLQVSTLKLIQFDKFEEMARLADEAKGVLERLRLSYPDEERDLRKEILDAQLQVWVEKFHSSVEKKDIGSAVDAIRKAIEANSELQQLVTGPAQAIVDVSGEVLKSRQAVASGEDFLEKWNVKEARACFAEAERHLSSAKTLVESFRGDPKPPTLVLNGQFVRGFKLLNDGLVALADAVDKAITGRQAAAEKDFSDSIQKFKTADDAFSGAGPRLARSAVKARRYATMAGLQSSALKLSLNRFIIGAGKQSGLFTILMLGILSLVSLRVTSLTPEQIVYVSVFLGLVFGFGLDAIRFKDILPWSGKSSKKPE